MRRAEITFAPSGVIKGLSKGSGCLASMPLSIQWLRRGGFHYVRAFPYAVMSPFKFAPKDILQFLLYSSPSVFAKEMLSFDAGPTIETTVLQLVHLCTLRTRSQFATGILAYVSAMHNGKLHKIVSGMVKEIEAMQEETLIAPAGAPAEQAGWDDARSAFGTLVDHWEIFKKTKMAQHVRKLVALCLLGGIVSEEFTKEHDIIYKRLTSGVDASKFDSLDIAEEVVRLARVVWDCVAECCRTKTFSPLLGMSSKIVKVEVEQAYLTSHMEWFMLGSLERMEATKVVDESDETFAVRVEKQKAVVLGMHASAFVPAERLALSRMLKELSHMEARIRERCTRGSMRKEPFTVKLDGTTGVGKSSITVKLARDILRIQGEPSGDDFVAVVSATSKYMDTVTNHTKAIIMDDVKAVKTEHCKDNNESQTIIEIRNVMMTPVSKAAVDEKGGTFINASVFIMSTNDPMMGAFETATEPSATLRRCNVHIMVTVDPAYSKGGVGDLKLLDGCKMTEGMYTDAQDFVVAEWVPYARTAVRGDSGGFRILTPKLKYSELMEWLKPVILAHDELQTRMLEEMRQDESDELCEHGFTTAKSCHHCRGRVYGERATESVYVHGYEYARNATHQAGEFADLFRLHRPNTPAEPSVASMPRDIPRELITPLDLCSHGLEVCPVCHPMEESPMAPQSYTLYERVCLTRARIRSAYHEWNDVPMCTPEEPTLVSCLSAICGGVNHLEDLFIRYPHHLLTFLYTSVPATTFVGVQSLFWACGLCGTLSLCASLFSGVAAAALVSHSAVTYIRGRVAGLSLSQLRSRMIKLSTGFAGVLMCATIGALLTALALRKVLAPKKSVESVTSVGKVQTVHFGPYTENGGCHSAAPTEPTEAPRDPKPRSDVWTRRQLVTFEAPEQRVATMTRPMIVAALQRQLFVVKVTYRTTERVTMGWMVCTNHLLMPAHNFLRKDGSASEIVSMELRTTTAQSGPVFTVKIGACSTVRMEGDMMLVQVNAGGTMQNLTRFMTDEPFAGNLPVEEFTRDFETCASVVTRYHASTIMAVSSQYGWQYPALEYTRGEPTYMGLCGALIVSADRYARVLGLHSMGNGPYGVACLVTKRGVELALEQLRLTGLVSSPIVTQNSTSVYVPSGFESSAEMSPLSERSVLREAPEGAPLLPMGTLANYAQVRPKSNLAPSPISELVREQCGMERCHEAPRNIGKATVEVRKLREMEGLSQLAPDVLKIAKADMQQEMVAVMLAGGLERFLTPLNAREACSGIPGSTGVKRLNLSTSAGFPLKGGKRPLVQPSPTEESPDAIEPTPEQLCEIANVWAKMEKLERVNFVFKCSHKDEAVKMGKEKVRVFEGAPFALIYLTRKLYLPVMRLYFMCQLQTESAVGINAYGKEWDELFEWMATYNPHEVVEGDWQHFDMSESYQEIMTLFSMWMEIVITYGNYTQSEVNVMWVIAEETARHYALYKGDVAEVDGTNASGNGLTVFINNSVNGLRQRCAFYALCPDVAASVERFELGGITAAGVVFDNDPRAPFAPFLPQLSGRFADYVRAIFYGDDFLMAVKPDILSWYNQQSIAAWFATQGKPMTDANKQPFTTPTITWGEASFLKRSFRWDADTGRRMAPLSIASIYKPLHMWPRTLAESKEAHAASVIGGALRELFQHGRAVYEERAPKLVAVAEIVGCQGYLDCDLSYDAALVEWRSDNA